MQMETGSFQNLAERRDEAGQVLVKVELLPLLPAAFKPVRVIGKERVAFMGLRAVREWLANEPGQNSRWDDGGAAQNNGQGQSQK
jgi:hypothetical protein